MERLAHADGLQPEGLVKSQEQIQQEMMQAAQQQLAQKSIPGVVQEGAKAMMNRNTNTPNE